MRPKAGIDCPEGAELCKTVHKDMRQHAPQPKFESRLLLFPVYEASKVKQVLKVQKVHRFPVFREYRIF